MTTQPHILCVDCFPTWGGGQAVLVKQVAQLLADGYRVTVVCPAASPLLAGRLPAGATAVGLPMNAAVTDFARRAFSPAGLVGQARLARQLTAIMRQQRASLVYALGSRSAKAAVLATVLQGVPLCWSAHNANPLDVLDHYLCRHSAAIVCVSNAVRQLYAAIPGSASRVHLVYNSIDTKAFASGDGGDFRRELGLAGNNTLVGMISRISPEKGQALFVEALLPLLREFDALHGVIIGAANERDRKYEIQLQETIAHSGVAPRFHLTGWRNDVQALLPALDVVALTSAREGFPMTVLEAMAAARPVAAFSSGGAVEAIVDGVTGLVIPPGDVAAMTQAIRRLILNPTERAAMGQAAQQRAREMFDDRKVLPQFSVIIGEILRKRDGATTT